MKRLERDEGWKWRFASQLGVRELVAFVVRNQSTLIWRYIVLSIAVMATITISFAIVFRTSYIHSIPMKIHRSRSNKYIFREFYPVTVRMLGKFCFSCSFRSIGNVTSGKVTDRRIFGEICSLTRGANLNSGYLRIDELLW